MRWNREGEKEGRKRRVGNDLLNMSVIRSSSCSAAAIFCAGVGAGWPNPRNDMGGAFSCESLDGCERGLGKPFLRQSGWVSRFCGAGLIQPQLINHV